MPSYSSTDSMPFQRHNPANAVSNLFGLPADTIPGWSERSPFPDFQPSTPVQLEAPQQSVSIPPESIWIEMVSRHREALERQRAHIANNLNRPSRLFMGFSQSYNPSRPSREFMGR